MTKIIVNILNVCMFLMVASVSFAQKVAESKVPGQVKTAFLKKYPEASKVTWEDEKGNFEANWGGKSGEGTSVQYKPDGTFVEQVLAIPVSTLPLAVSDYVKANYKGAKITEAGKVTDAKGVHMYEAEVKGKDLIFDENGKFLKKD